MLTHNGKNDPILAELRGSQDELIIRVKGGLYFINGNRRPYFSIVCGNGADHERILKYFPKFKDLVELHLSNIDGIPMHSLENGYYWIAGALLGHFGEKWHGGLDKTAFECLGIFADHCRITYDEAKEILKEISVERNPKGKLKEILDTMKPRWKQEALDCIAKHDLQVFGDPWTE